MNETDISYLTHTWNPIAMRCTKVSPACDHCWHLSWAKRHAGNPNFTDDVRAAYAGDAPPLLVEHRLQEPLSKRKPARIGVQFMGDLFHEDVSDGYIQQVFKVMHETPQHTYQLLTKRPHRMKMFFVNNVNNAGMLHLRHNDWAAHPLPNVHLGVTAEDQKRADERIPVLLQIPAAFHYVSLEPLLSGIRFHSRWLSGYHYESGPLADGVRRVENNSLSLAIVGGETGPGARPMHPAWPRSLRDQCASAGVGFHFKSWGEWQGVDQSSEMVKPGTPEYVFDDGTICFRVGAKRAGHLLDGVEHRDL